MRIPKKIKVGGHIYKVEVVDRVETDPGENNCGDCDWQINRIRVKKDLPESQKAETFLHEIIHACNTDMAEKEVNNLSFKLYQVLADNDLLK